MSERLPKSCCLDPCENPNALEFGKCHKSENNNGCGCDGDTSNVDNAGADDDTELDRTVIRQSFTREDFAS